MRNLIEFLKKYNYWLVFVLLEVVSLVLICQYNSYQGSVWFTSANYLTGMGLEVDSKMKSFMTQGTTNQELSERNLMLERELWLTKELLAEERLRHDSTHVDSVPIPQLAEYKLINAKVIGNSLNKADNLITIDKGYNNGVHEDMGVACGNGVVGVVYKASRHYAIVIPVLNMHSNISCTIQGHGYFGYLHWKGGATDIAFVDDIPRHAQFEKGDTIVTSGYSSLFPPGVLVGHVIDSHDSEDGLSYRLEIKLSTDFGNLREVCVIDDAAVNERLNLLRQATDSLKNQRNQ